MVPAGGVLGDVLEVADQERVAWVKWMTQWFHACLVAHDALFHADVRSSHHSTTRLGLLHILVRLW